MSWYKKYSVLFLCLLSSLAIAQPVFTVNIIKTENNCAFTSVRIEVSGGKAPYNISWSNGAFGEYQTNLLEGDYILFISDSDSTLNDTSISFHVNPAPCTVYIPNRFTPNNDGINDTWGISYADNYPDFLLQVFNKWGQLVHEQRHEYKPWNGTQLGLEVPDATYYYMFFFKEHDSSKFEKGSVTIIR